MTDHRLGGPRSNAHAKETTGEFALIDVVLDGSVGGVFVGASARHVGEHLGDPRSDPGCATRRSPVLEHDYGNTSVLVHREWVVGVTIEPTPSLDFLVSTSGVEEWTSARWRDQLGSSWRLVPFLAHVQLIGPTAALAFDENDRLHVVTLAPRAASVAVRRPW